MLTTKLLASKSGRAALARNNYKSGTLIAPVEEDESLGHFYTGVDQAAGPKQSAVAAVLVDGQLHMASVTPIEVSKTGPRAEPTRESVTADPKATVGMFFRYARPRRSPPARLITPTIRLL